MAKLRNPSKHQGKNIKVLENQHINTDTQTIVISLEFVQKNYCFEFLDKDEKAAVASSIFKRSKLQWLEIQNTHKHGLGMEKIARKALKAPIPEILLIKPVCLFFLFLFSALPLSIAARADIPAPAKIMKKE
jgi:hypothetical protein